MRSKLALNLFFFLFLTVFFSIAKAQGVRYITDELRVHLRAGPGTEFRILQTLKSRNKLTLLESGNNWSKVDYEGVEGYVPSQYLIFTSTALIDPNEMNVDLDDKIDFQNSQDIIQIQQQAIERLGNENKNLLIQKNKLTQELNSLNDLSKYSEKLQKEREELFTRIVESKNRYQLLENVVASSNDTKTKNWMFITLGLSILAFLLGIASTTLKRKKKRRLY